jgi:hypothetical protein
MTAWAIPAINELHVHYIDLSGDMWPGFRQFTTLTPKRKSEPEKTSWRAERD